MQNREGHHNGSQKTTRHEKGGKNIIFRRGEEKNIIFGPKYRPLQQPEIHPVMSAPHIFRKLCHILLSVSISVTICF
jgi:hypothetical protein